MLFRLPVLHSSTSLPPFAGHRRRLRMHLSGRPLSDDAAIFPPPGILPLRALFRLDYNRCVFRPVLATASVVLAIGTRDMLYLKCRLGLVPAMSKSQGMDVRLSGRPLLTSLTGLLLRSSGRHRPWALLWQSISAWSWPLRHETAWEIRPRRSATRGHRSRRDRPIPRRRACFNLGQSAAEKKSERE